MPEILRILRMDDFARYARRFGLQRMEGNRIAHEVAVAGPLSPPQHLTSYIMWMRVFRVTMPREDFEQLLKLDPGHRLGFTREEFDARKDALLLRQSEFSYPEHLHYLQDNPDESCVSRSTGRRLEPRRSTAELFDEIRRSWGWVPHPGDGHLVPPYTLLPQPSANK